MSATGRVTLPADARKALGLEAETEFEVSVDKERDVLILRRVFIVPREDAWAYTPEHRAVLARAHADVRAGRVYRLTEEDLMALAEDPKRLKEIKRRARRVSDA